MVAAGVFLLSSRARWAIAEDLAKLDICGDDIARLHRWLASTEPKEGLQRRYLAGLLSNPPEVAEALKTLDRHAETRKREDRNAMDYEAEDGVERDAHMVFGRIHGDGHTAEAVAADMGWELSQVQSLYAMGHKMFGGGV